MLKKNLNKLNGQQGFTLPEVMVAAVIFIVAFVGILVSYLRCMELSEMSRNASRAMTAVKSRMEDIKNTDFSAIEGTYDEVDFDVTSFGNKGKGVSYVDSTIPDLLQVTVSFSWQEKNGRIVGEDKDLDGDIGAGEDLDGDNMLSSPVQITTYIFDE